MLEWIRALSPLFLGILVLIFYRAVAPVLSLGVAGEWLGPDDEYLRLRLTIENKSRVRASLGRCRVQLLEHQWGSAGFLSEWLPFDAGTVKSGEEPIAWAEPQALNSPEHLYAGEATTIELLYRFPQKRLLLHAGFQISVEVRAWQRMLSGEPVQWQNTAAAWIVKGKAERAA